MIAKNLAKVQSRINAINHPQVVQLIVVSKTRTSAELQLVVDAGQLHFGENYLQEALDKIDSLKNQGLIWHFIGPIQSNKTSGSELPVGMGLSISLRENTPPAQIQRLKSLGHILAAD